MLLRLQLQGTLVRLSSIGWALSQNIFGPHIFGIFEFGEFVRALVYVYIFTAIAESVLVPSIIKIAANCKSDQRDIVEFQCAENNLALIFNDLLKYYIALIIFLLLVAGLTSRYYYILISILILGEYLLIQFPIALGYSLRQFTHLSSAFFAATLVQLAGMYLLSAFGALGALISTALGLGTHIAILLSSMQIRHLLLRAMTISGSLGDKNIRKDYLRLVLAKAVQIFSFSGVLLISSFKSPADAMADLKLAQTVVSAGAQSIPISQETFQVWLTQSANMEDKRRKFWVFAGAIFLLGLIVATVFYYFGGPVFEVVFSRSLSNYSGLYFAIPFVAATGLFVSRLYVIGEAAVIPKVAIWIVSLGMLLSLFVGPVLITITVLIVFFVIIVGFLAKLDISDNCLTRR